MSFLRRLIGQIKASAESQKEPVAATIGTTNFESSPVPRRTLPLPPGEVTVQGQRVILPDDFDEWGDDEWQLYFISDAPKEFVIRGIRVVLPADMTTWTSVEWDIFSAARLGWSPTHTTHFFGPDFLRLEARGSELSPEILAVADILSAERDAIDDEIESLDDYGDEDTATRALTSQGSHHYDEQDEVDEEYWQEQRRLNDDAYWADVQMAENQAIDEFYANLELTSQQELSDWYDDQQRLYGDNN